MSRLKVLSDRVAGFQPASLRPGLPSSKAEGVSATHERRVGKLGKRRPRNKHYADSQHHVQKVLFCEL
jgi:hypothetical protein